MIIDFLFSIFGKNTIYIKFSSDLIHIRYAEKDRIIEEKPVIAISKIKNRYKVVAVGKDSVRTQASPKVQVYNVFKHPRAFLPNFEFAEVTLRYFIYKIVHRKMLVRPIIVLHPTEKLDGGITQIEFKSLVELGTSIGGRKVFIWKGHTLTNRELLDPSFLEKNCLESPDIPLNSNITRHK